MDRFCQCDSVTTLHDAVTTLYRCVVELKMKTLLGKESNFQFPLAHHSGEPQKPLSCGLFSPCVACWIGRRPLYSTAKNCWIISIKPIPYCQSCLISTNMTLLSSVSLSVLLMGLLVSSSRLDNPNSKIVLYRHRLHDINRRLLQSRCEAQ